MENANDYYYIVVQNRSYRHEYGNDDYHLEKVFSKGQIIEIIGKEVLSFFDHRYFIIVTNDETFLNKHLYTINIDELKMLCKIEDYNKENIRINQNYFFGFCKEVYTYFQKILNEEIISSTMLWISKTNCPYDDKSIGIEVEIFNRWGENKEFQYFKTPVRYRKDLNTESVFSCEDFKIGNIETFKKMVNVNILEINTLTQPDKKWEFRNGLLKYYDKISATRFFIHETLLQVLKQDETSNFYIETKFNSKHYIEYYIIGIYNSNESDQADFEVDNDKKCSYDNYNRAYGFDDDTIDSAFEGDPKNYWNID